MTPTIPITRDLVLIGGGHAHALVLRRWGMRPLPGARLTLINPTPTAPYTGMLPGFVAGHYSRDELEIDLVRLARFAGARIIFDEAVGLDLRNKTVALATRPSVSFDVASINIGVTSEVAARGFDEYATPAKPLNTFAERWNRFVDDVAAGSASPRAAVVGGGVGGAELALAMAWRLKQVAGENEVRVALIEAAEQLIPSGSGALRRRLGAELRAAGVEVKVGRRATAAEPDGVALDDGRHVPADFIVTAAGANSQAWLEASGLACHEGFVRVDTNLRSVSHDFIFAAGDAAHLEASPREKAGVFAVREAPVLEHNLRAALTGGSMRPFRPQRDYLKLVGLGARQAIGTKWGLVGAGAFAWRWKERIDRRFMDRLNHPPSMVRPEPPQGAAIGVAEAMADEPPCGGCGAKIGPARLGDALRELRPYERDDVLKGAGE